MYKWNIKRADMSEESISAESDKAIRAYLNFLEEGLEND